MLAPCLGKGAQKIHRVMPLLSSEGGHWQLKYLYNMYFLVQLSVYMYLAAGY
ncbi:hypothetical protein B0I35DRAFT_434031 [Stachybotrys elegans]|uniref:Uncharacterized protein n=1 Tax=Stachybotrys elegans TaxID=80388 RepID=A0A8K0WQ15_9HYPO|nr:hypothetical protein B0I35DRAFT_434031 [Stachybotrys elegans]